MGPRVAGEVQIGEILDWVLIDEVLMKVTLLFILWQTYSLKDIAHLYNGLILLVRW